MLCLQTAKRPHHLLSTGWMLLKQVMLDAHVAVLAPVLPAVLPARHAAGKPFAG